MSGEPLQLKDLRAGDVLLAAHADPFSWALRQADGAEVDGAWLVLEEARVLGLGPEGPEVTSASEVVAKTGDAWVRRLREPGSLAPVLSRASRFLAAPFRDEPLVRLALTLLSRPLRATPSLGELLRTTLDAGARRLAALHEAGCEPLCGAELVFRAYDEALPEATDLYTIHLHDAHMLEPTAAGPSAPASGLLRRRGRGVHPSSLLARSLARSRLAPDRHASWSPSAGGAPLVAELVERYRAELRADAQAGRPRDEATYGSLEHFAEAWNRAVPPSTTAPPPPTSRLFRAACELVTAGDLQRTLTLFTVGRLTADGLVG